MIRSDRNLVLLVLASFGIMYLCGMVVLRINPPTELDRVCLSKSLLEIRECFDRVFTISNRAKHYWKYQV